MLPPRGEAVQCLWIVNADQFTQHCPHVGQYCVYPAPPIFFKRKLEVAFSQRKEIAQKCSKKIRWSCWCAIRHFLYTRLNSPIGKKMLAQNKAVWYKKRCEVRLIISFQCFLHCGYNCWYFLRNLDIKLSSPISKRSQILVWFYWILMEIFSNISEKSVG